jgi:hypothetical protein
MTIYVSEAELGERRRKACEAMVFDETVLVTRDGNEHLSSVTRDLVIN